MFVAASSYANPQAVYRSLASASWNPGNAATTGGSEVAAGGSVAGSQVQSALADFSGAGDTAAQVEAARSWLGTSVADFAAAVGNKFRDAGVRIQPEPMLAVASDGQVTVVTDHPDQQQIERLFANDTGLQQQFTRIAATATQVQAADNYKSYSAEYQSLSGQPAAQKALAEQQASRAGGLRFHLVLTPHGPEYFFPGSVAAKV